MIAEVLKYMICSLVDYPDEVEVSDVDHTRLLKVYVNPADMGMVIGREGKTIEDIRSILQCIDPNYPSLFIRVFSTQDLG